MPCATPEEQREYQRKWMAARRAAWFEGKSCVQCGSTERLELDHIDPATKVHHAIWSWSAERREAELDKCQPLCHDCHKEKTREFNSVPHGGGIRGRANCLCVPCTVQRRKYWREKRRREYRSAKK